jgi:hypothetical protein
MLAMLAKTDVDKSASTINRYVNGGLQGVAQMELKTAEIQTAGGLQGCALLNEKQIIEVVSKYNPSLLIKFAQCGLRVFLHQLAGFEINSTAIEQRSVRQLPVHTPADSQTIYFFVLPSTLTTIKQVQKCN